MEPVAFDRSTRRVTFLCPLGHTFDLALADLSFAGRPVVEGLEVRLEPEERDVRVECPVCGGLGVLPVSGGARREEGRRLALWLMWRRYGAAGVRERLRAAVRAREREADLGGLDALEL